MTSHVDVARDPEGFLLDLTDWSEPLAAQLAQADGFEMTDEVMRFIAEARALYEARGQVPPLRLFAKRQQVSIKDLYDIFKKDPMRRICKWGGLPKPTGCS